MNIREKFSVGLLSMGLILAVLPLPGNISLSVKPQALLSEILDDKSYFTVDQVARFVVSEDSTIRLIDLRSAEEFGKANIPGSVNVPYNNLFNYDPSALFADSKIKYILYSTGDLDANYALVIAMGMNFENIYVMRGGLNEWFKTVMNSSFSGDKISARENAIFENRARARNLFTELNSLPDSLKLIFVKSKQAAAKKLDGGCE